MLKKTITYKDFNGVEKTQAYYFNFTEAEVLELEMSEHGGLAEMIDRIVKEENGPEIAKIFKDLVLKAYGEKSVNGDSFVKFDEDGRPLSRKFAQTAAYSALYTELATNAKAAADFFNGVIPNKANPTVPVSNQ